MDSKGYVTLKSGLSKALKEHKVEDGGMVPDLSNFLNEGELEELLTYTDETANKLTAAESQIKTLQSDLRFSNKNASEWEDAYRKFKRIHPISIVALGLIQLWVCFLAGATLEWKLAYLRQWHFCMVTSVISAIFAFALIVWAGSHEIDRWYR